MIYLDSSSTTVPCEHSIQAAAKVVSTNYGNPSSLHSLGIRAGDVLKRARTRVAAALNCHPQEVVFTSGGTESNNIAIFSAARLKVGKTVITQATEHSSVLEPFKQLERRGFNVVYLPVNRMGAIDLDRLEALLEDSVSLVSIMQVNNETGAIMPVDQIAAMLARKCPKAWFHVDAVQALGKLPMCTGAQLISVSAHKIHGLMGTGALVCRKPATITPLMFGGGQEDGRRNGTQNLPGIVAFAAALERGDAPADNKRLNGLQAEFLCRIKAVDGVEINSPPNGICSIVNLSFHNVSGQVLQNSLSAKGVMVSMGAACSGKKNSHVLAAMGVKNIKGAIRVSFSRFNTLKEIQDACDIICESVKELRI